MVLKYEKKNPVTSLSGFFVGFCMVCFLMVALPACLSPRKMDKWVDKKYGDVLAVQPKKNVDYLSVSTGLTTADKKNSTSAKTTSKLLPLIFYWHYQMAITCTLNPKIPVNNFTNTVMTYAGSKGLKRKLNGRRVELTIDQLPNAFALDDDSHMIWFIYAFGWDIFSIQPANSNLVVSYKIMQENNEVKNGVITVPDPSKKYYLKQFTSTKKKTWQYLDQYNDNITTMSKKVIDELLTGL